jgi:hypothetical protein
MFRAYCGMHIESRLRAIDQWKSAVTMRLVTRMRKREYCATMRSRVRSGANWIDDCIGESIAHAEGFVYLFSIGECRRATGHAEDFQHGLPSACLPGTIVSSAEWASFAVI